STLGIGIFSSAVSSLFCAGAKWESAKTRLMIRQFLGTKVYRIAQPKGENWAVANRVSSVAACLPSNAPKLSDRGWRGQAWSTKKGRPPASVRWSAWLGGGSFLALVILPRCWTDYLALWYRDGPLVAVGMVV